MKHNSVKMMMMIVNNPVKVKFLAEFPSSPVVCQTKSRLNRIILMIVNNQHNAVFLQADGSADGPHESSKNTFLRISREKS